MEYIDFWNWCFVFLIGNNRNVGLWDMYVYVKVVIVICRNFVGKVYKVMILVKIKVIVFESVCFLIFFILLNVFWMLRYSGYLYCLVKVWFNFDCDLYGWKWKIKNVGNWWVLLII